MGDSGERGGSWALNFQGLILGVCAGLFALNSFLMLSPLIPKALKSLRKNWERN